MAQAKKATGSKSAVKQVAARVKSAVGAAKKKVAPPAKKAAPPAKPAAKAKAPAKPPAKAAKPAPKPTKPVKKAAPAPAKKAAPAPAKAAAKVKAVAKVVQKAVAKAAKPVVKAVTKPAPKSAAKETAKPAKALPKAVPAKPPEKKVAAAPAPPKATAASPAPAKPAPKPAAADDKAKRGRRARPRVTSSGVPAASWLTSEKPRAASFIPAPPRAEAPSAIAAPPASSDRLLRDDDVIDLAVRTVPVRIDVEQGAGRFYIHANPLEVTLRTGEGIEWDFRYLGGADVMCDEIIVEFEKPSPFAQASFKTRKPGGARPHRQLSGPLQPSAAGKRIPYTVRAMTAFKTELANAKLWMQVLLA